MFTRKPVVWCEKAICFIRLQPSDRLTRENLELSSAITFSHTFFKVDTGYAMYAKAF